MQSVCSICRHPTSMLTESTISSRTNVDRDNNSVNGNAGTPIWRTLRTQILRIGQFIGGTVDSLGANRRQKSHRRYRQSDLAFVMRHLIIGTAWMKRKIEFTPRTVPLSVWVPFVDPMIPWQAEITLGFPGMRVSARSLNLEAALGGFPKNSEAPISCSKQKNKRVERTPTRLL